MTLTELAAAVTHLGFSSTLEDNEELLREAAGRALSEIAAMRPRCGTAVLYHCPPKPLFLLTGNERCGKEKRYAFPFAGSLFLRLYGRGNVRVSFPGEEKNAEYAAMPPDAPAEIRFCAKTAGRAEIKICPLGGETLLLCLCAYMENGKEVPDPLGATRYDLTRYDGDFLALVAAPTDQNGTPFREGDGRLYGEYVAENAAALSLPNRYPTELTVRYRKRLRIGEDGKIPVTPEEEQMLTFLCAAYVWLDDDPEHAAFYFARARESEAKIPRAPSGSGVYRITDGWG